MSLKIKDIAKMADVSSATVSKVINNYHGVNENTKKKVMDIIKETGYQPNFSAKSLATKKSNLIGLIYAGKVNVEFTHPFFTEVVTAFKKNIGQLGFDILMFSNENFSQDNGSYLARCKHFHVDGCIIITGEEIEESIYDLVNSEIPCIGIDLVLEGPHSSYVMTDNITLGSKVVQHLYLSNVRNIGFIGGQRDSEVTKLRGRGYVQAMNQFGLEVKEEWVEYGDYYEDSGYTAMKKILEAPVHPEAVFAASDMMAFGALMAIKEAGLKVPEDIRLIGCDDIDACRYSAPPLSTVKQDKERLGKLAAYMLNDLINGKAELQPVFIESELIVRESCGSLINKSKIVN